MREDRRIRDEIRSRQHGEASLAYLAPFPGETQVVRTGYFKAHKRPAVVLGKGMRSAKNGGGSRRVPAGETPRPIGRIWEHLGSVHQTNINRVSGVPGT